MIKCVETQFKAWKQKSSFQLTPELCSRQVPPLEVVQMGAAGTWAAHRGISSTQKQSREEVLQHSSQKAAEAVPGVQAGSLGSKQGSSGVCGTAIANGAQVPGVC